LHRQSEAKLRGRSAEASRLGLPSSPSPVNSRRTFTLGQETELMYYTHYFANHATFERALYWLRQLGFSPASIEAPADGIPRISVALKPSLLPGVEMLIDSVERGDPRGWPGLYDVARLDHVYPGAASAAAARPASGRSTAIGWHPHDAPSAGSAEVD